MNTSLDDGFQLPILPKSQQRTPENEIAGQLDASPANTTTASEPKYTKHCTDSIMPNCPGSHSHSSKPMHISSLAGFSVVSPPAPGTTASLESGLKRSLTPTRKSMNLKNLQLNLSSSPSFHLSSSNKTCTPPLDSPKLSSITLHKSLSSHSTLASVSRSPSPPCDESNILNSGHSQNHVHGHNLYSPRSAESLSNSSHALSSTSSNLASPSVLPGSEIPWNNVTPPPLPLPKQNSNYQIPPPLKSFKRTPSYNPSYNSSSPPTTSFKQMSPSKTHHQRKKSATLLAISIPKNSLGGDLNNEKHHFSKGPMTGTVDTRSAQRQRFLDDNSSSNHVKNTQQSYDINLVDGSNGSNAATSATTANRPVPVLPLGNPVRKMMGNTSSETQFMPNRSLVFQANVPSSSPELMSPINNTINSKFEPLSSDSYSSEIKPQTIMHLFSDTPNPENCKLTYPDGPVCVLEPNLFLYSEPTLEEVHGFDTIINVAQELTDFSDEIYDQNVKYYFIPWTHTSKLSIDFPKLTNIIDEALSLNKKVLIHCQCGVSRSASLIIAYFMKKFNTSYNDGYNRLKLKVPQISPNLSLIYELIEWQDHLQKGNSIDS